MVKVSKYCILNLFFQTLNSISAEKNSTVIFPLPIDLIGHLLGKDILGDEEDEEEAEHREEEREEEIALVAVETRMSTLEEDEEEKLEE